MEAKMIQVGTIIETQAVKWEFDDSFRESCVARHMVGDHGENTHSDLRRSLAREGKFASVYSQGSKTLWVITYPASVATLLCTQKDLAAETTSQPNE